MKSSALSKVTIYNAQYVADAPSGHSVLHVRDPHALIRAAGYLKFLARENHQSVYFRGQCQLYDGLSPSLFRGYRTQSAQTKRVNLLRKAIDAAKANNKIFKDFSATAHEPLLQHYGLRTSWIDLVDNVWVALWFGCHDVKSSGKFHEYFHFEKRVITGSQPNYVYILLVEGTAKPTAEAGYFQDQTTEVVDLRTMCPSIFLRPHAQHGVLFRVRGGHPIYGTAPIRSMDYSAQIRGIVRIDLTDALSGLGSGQMLGVHALFPPPYYDFGYGILLKGGIPASTETGSIAHVGA